MIEIHKTLQEAYDKLNAELFDGDLNGAMILIHRKKGAHGYFWADQFRVNGNNMDEISLNPETMGRTNKIVLSTLLHEMCHQWQYQYGKPSRGNYHNKQFSVKMEQVGLITSHDGTEDGNRTGNGMTHYILEDGVYDKWFDTITINFDLFAIVPLKKNYVSKTSYKCGCPKLTVYGKPNLNITCNDCGVEMYSND